MAHFVLLNKAETFKYFIRYYIGMDAWQRQKENQALPIPTIEDIKDMLLGIPEERVRALVSILYLTAGRLEEVMALKPSNIERIEQEDKVIILVKNMKNEKNKKRPFKDIPIILEKEGNIYQHIVDYIKNNNIGLDNRLFPFSSRRAEQLLAQHLNINPHFFRHIRLTHLASIYRFPDQALKTYAGWTTSIPAQYYIELKWQDLADKF